MKFLIVDDQDSARRMLRQIVCSNPSWLVVGEATNGQEAIARMDREPQVVLMDIIMPIMDGLEATRQIKRLAPETTVILTTAYQNHEFRVRSLKVGADGFFLKDDLSTDTVQAFIGLEGKSDG
jgi:DNA-binding NarL/FixJ family response regulator